MTKVRRFRISALAAIAISFAGSATSQAADLGAVIRDVQPKIVKVYGAGGYRGLEAYQSGFLISAEGHVLTAWSYVLDTDYITVTLNDGRKFEEVKLLGADPRLELAVLKLEATELAHFDLAQAAVAEPGARVLAFSNLYGVAFGDEPASVQHGVVSTVTKLNARRGVFATPYEGPAYVLDAMTNNPGAAGGALVDYRGRLLGMLGKELRHAQSNIWLNFAIPAPELRPTVDAIVAGKYVRKPADDAAMKIADPHNLDLLGVSLVPDVLQRTPPYVDAVAPESPAASAGIRPDDLFLFVNNRITQSCEAVRNELATIHRVDPVRVTVLRGQELIEATLTLPKPTATSAAKPADGGAAP